MHDKFQGSTVDVQAAMFILNSKRANPMLCTYPNVCHYAVHDLIVMDGSFQVVTVNVHAHTLNCKNKYLTLLYVYKAATSTSTLLTVLIICTTSFRVVQLMYRPLL